MLKVSKINLKYLEKNTNYCKNLILPNFAVMYCICCTLLNISFKFYFVALLHYCTSFLCHWRFNWYEHIIRTDTHINEYENSITHTLTNTHLHMYLYVIQLWLFLLLAQCCCCINFPNDL